MFENIITPRIDVKPRAVYETVYRSTTNNIIDISSEKTETELRNSLQDSIQAACHGEAAMPDLLLWDKKGLQYFEDVTYTPSYYLTDEEIGILEEQKYQIAQCIQPGSMFIELGSGNLRKIKILLEALDDLGRDVDYFALDVSLPELQRTLNMVPPGTFRHIRCFGLLGTYDDGRRWLQRPELESRPKVLISLGSTVGSMRRFETAEFLSGFIGSGESNRSFLLGLDGCKDQERVLAAYNDKHGNNHRFIKNGLERANEILGHEAFDLEKWDVVGSWNRENGSHDQYYYPKTDVSLSGEVVPAGRRILAIQSHKYDANDAHMLLKEAGLDVVDAWGSRNQYNLLFLKSV